MNNKNSLRILLAIFLIRFGLSLLPSFEIDMGAWLAWAERLAMIGPTGFYTDEVWTQYTPGFLYWLLLIGKLGIAHPLTIKTVVIVADMLTAYMIRKVIYKTDKTLANWAFGLYVLSPVAIMDGSIWGQIDGILTLFMFGATYLLVEQRKYYLSYVALGVAFLIKPQMIAMLPVFLIVTLVRFGIKKTLLSWLVGIVTVLIGYYPFYPTNPLAGLFELIQKMGVSYSYTSLFAFNFWSYVGMWIPDNIKWQGMSYFGWGTIWMAAAFVLLIYRYRRYLGKRSEIYLLLAISCFIFFLFPTRVHERYLFPMFAFLLAYGGAKKSIAIGMIWTIMTILYTTNLYLPYSYYEPLSNPLKNIWLEDQISKVVLWIATGQIMIFASLWLFPTRKNDKKIVPETTGHGETIEHRRDK